MCFAESRGFPRPSAFEDKALWQQLEDAARRCQGPSRAIFPWTMRPTYLSIRITKGDTIIMQYRELGRAGIRVSTIALGSWLTYGNAVAEEAAIACIHRAYELGINFFDTANVYNRGAAEEVVGRGLREFSRDSYVLATKVYFPMGEGPNDRGPSRKHIMEQCNASLRRLGTDYIDVY